MADAGLPMGQGVYNPATGRVEVPEMTSVRDPYSVTGQTRKKIEPGALAAQGDLARAQEEKIATLDKTIPLDDIPEELLTPGEMERKWEGGINQPPAPAPQQPASLRPGMAPVAMVPDQNAPAPQPQPEGITKADYEDRVKLYDTIQKQEMERRLRQQQAQKAAAFEAQRQQREAAFRADKEEVARLSRPENLFAKPSTGQRILNAIAAGLGAWGATMGRTENFAMNIIQKRLEEDAKMRQFALNSAIKKAQMSGASIDQLIKMQAEGDKQLKEARVNQTYWIDANVAKMQARWPAKAQEAAQLRAGLEIEKAKGTRDFLAQYGGGSESSQNYGQVVQHSSGKSSSGGAPTEAERNYAVHGRTMLRAMEEMANLPQPSKKALSVVQANEGYMLAAVEESKTVKGAWWTEFLRKLDALPRSDLSDLSDSDQIYVNAMERINNAFLRITSGAAIKNDEFVRQADQLVLRADDSPAVRAYKMREMRAVTEDIMTLSGRAGQMLMDRDAQREGASSGELPGGARVPPEGQTPAQKRYTQNEEPEVRKSLEAASGKTGVDVRTRPLTDRQMGKALKKMPSNIKEGVREAMKVPKGSPKYDMAQKYLREKYEEYAP